MKREITQEELDNLSKIYFRITFDGHYLGIVSLDTSKFSDLEKIKLLDSLSKLKEKQILEEL